MRKLLLTASLVVLAMAANAQKNLFDPADVDADGWLWFDTQEKIDKYVSICDEDNYRLDPNGKIIQLVYADQMPDYPAPVADPDMYGIGSDAWQYGEIDEETGLPMGMDAIKGSIMLPASTAMMEYNGGGIAMMLPSCIELSIKASCEASMYLRYLCSKENDAAFSDVNISESYVAHQWTALKTLSVFNSVKKGQQTITGLEKVNNGYYDLTIKSADPRYVYITHGYKYPIYIHAVRVIVDGESNAISNIEADAKANVRYNAMGQRVNNNAKGLVICNGAKTFVK